MARTDPGSVALKAQQDAAVAQSKALDAGNDAMQAASESATTTSSDAAHATYEKNDNPNPLGLNPPPGPSTIQYTGLPKGEG